MNRMICPFCMLKVWTWCFWQTRSLYRGDAASHSCTYMKDSLPLYTYTLSLSFFLSVRPSLLFSFLLSITLHRSRSPSQLQSQLLPSLEETTLPFPSLRNNKTKEKTITHTTCLARILGSHSPSPCCNAIYRFRSILIFVFEAVCSK